VTVAPAKITPVSKTNLDLQTKRFAAFDPFFGFLGFEIGCKAFPEAAFLLPAT
jgi:hypothetical protein